MRPKNGQNHQIGLRRHKVAIIYATRSGPSGLLCVWGPFMTHTESLADQGIEIMRKIVLAAAIATSALGLAACGETAEQADETADAMAADAEANAEAVEEAADEAADATAEAAADATEAVEEAVDEAEEAAE